MPVRVKICGLKTPETVAAAVDGGAAYIGFNFFAPSPRSVTLDEAKALTALVPPEVVRVALLVDPDDASLAQLLDRVPIDLVQLHGRETPERVAEVKARFGVPVMKAIGVAGPEDVTRIPEYEAVADRILVDAKPPKGARLPGGNATSFDWSLIAGRSWSIPWMLAGGLTVENVAEAIAQSGATELDLASGVETAPGEKDPALIRAFLAKVA